MVCACETDRLRQPMWMQGIKRHSELNWIQCARAAHTNSVSLCACVLCAFVCESEREFASVCGLLGIGLADAPSFTWSMRAANSGSRSNVRETETTAQRMECERNVEMSMVWRCGDGALRSGFSFSVENSTRKIQRTQQCMVGRLNDRENAMIFMTLRPSIRRHISTGANGSVIRTQMC